MKVFVTGAQGQLGHDVMCELKKRGHEAVGSDIHAGVSLDITDKQAVLSVLQDVTPDAVIHCAAWTAVDAAESEENQETVYAVNVTGTEHIVQACKQIGAKMMYISTDYVFDGQGETPWEPECKAYAPVNYYGETKLKGEHAVSSLLEKYYIVRIAWVFGENGANFVRTMLNIGKKYENLRVVHDQIGTPTYTFDLARLLVDMIESEKYGFYHATNEGEYISWYDFAKEIFAQAKELGHMEYSNERLKVTAVTTEEYGLSKAMRPKNSRLDRRKLEENGFQPLPHWREALTHYLKQIEF